MAWILLSFFYFLIFLYVFGKIRNEIKNRKVQESRLCHIFLPSFRLAKEMKRMARRKERKKGNYDRDQMVKMR